MIEDEWMKIRFQCGPIKEVGMNGATIEDVLLILAKRLEGFQKGNFRCVENTNAISGIEHAIAWLDIRTRRRQRQGVEGSDKIHKE